MVLMIASVLSISAFAQGSLIPCDPQAPNCPQGEECQYYDGIGYACGILNECSDFGLFADPEGPCVGNTLPCFIDATPPCIAETCCVGENGNGNGEVETDRPPCIVEGSFFIQDFSADIACKFTLWTGFPPEDGENGEEDGFFFDPFCMKKNELIVQGVIQDLGEGAGFIITEPIQQELFNLAEDAASFDGEGRLAYITELEVRTLENIADEFPNKLLDFLDRCEGGEINAETYIFCKQLLADMQKELGEAAKIVWYTPEAFWKVQILEDMQENIGHILVKFDESARGSFSADCSCDKGVELTDEITELIVDIIGDANSADVTVRSSSSECISSAVENCKLINEFIESAYDPNNCIQVYDCTNSEEDPGIISINGNGQARAIAHGPCGNDDDRDLTNQFAQVSLIGPGSIGPTGGAIYDAGIAGVSSELILAGVLVALGIALLIILRRK